MDATAADLEELILVFDAAAVRFGLPIGRVVEVVRAVALHRLPGAPAVIGGAFVLRGEVVPVFDFRSRFGLAPRPLDPSDRFIVAWARGRRVAVRADATGWLEPVAPEQVREPDSVAHGLDRIRGVVRLEGGIVLLHDLDTFLDDAEAAALDAALDREAP